MPRLTYNLADISDGPSYEHGRGKARLLKCVKGLSKASNKPQLIWTWKFISGPNKGQEIRTWTSLQENALSGLKEHLIALGERGKGSKQKVDANTDKLIGRVATLEVGESPSSAAGAKPFVGVIALFPLKTRDDDDDEDEDVDDDNDEDTDDNDDDDDDDENDDDEEDDDDDDEDEDDRPRKKKSSSKPAAKKRRR